MGPVWEPWLETVARKQSANHLSMHWWGERSTLLFRTDFRFIVWHKSWPPLWHCWAMKEFLRTLGPINNLIKGPSGVREISWLTINSLCLSGGVKPCALNCLAEGLQLLHRTFARRHRRHALPGRLAGHMHQWRVQGESYSSNLTCSAWRKSFFTENVL